MARTLDKRKIEGEFNFRNGPIKTTKNEKNKLKNKGTNKRPTGIKNLKF